MTNKQKSITLKEIAKFFLPLGMTTFLITITHTLFNSGLARLSKPEIYISAFALAKSLHNILQSPVLMTRQTATALIDSKDNYEKIKRFMIIIGAIIGLAYAIVAITPLSEMIFRNIMGIEEKETIESAVGILRVLIIFPVAIAFREFFQAIAIKNRMTPLITYATSMRLLFVFLMVVFVNRLTFIPENLMAGVMFLGAGIIEATVIFLGVKLSIGDIKTKVHSLTRKVDKKIRKIDNKDILGFFIPLVITNYINTFVMPVINIGLARADNAEFAISSYAVAWGLAVIVFGPLMMYHQVTLNYHKRKDKIVLRNFTYITVILTTLVFALISFTDIGLFILTKLIGTSLEMSMNAVRVLKVLTLFPIFMMIKEFYWGKLMSKRTTKSVWKAKASNLIVVTIVVFSLAYLGIEDMAIAGAIAMVSGAASEALYLYRAYIRSS